MRTSPVRCFGEIDNIIVQHASNGVYGLNARNVVSSETSSHGLGAVLLQEQVNGDMEPVSYISRLLSSVEEWYVQNEKEAIAFTWACERFWTF